MDNAVPGVGGSPPAGAWELCGSDWDTDEIGLDDVLPLVPCAALIDALTEALFDWAFDAASDAKTSDVVTKVEPEAPVAVVEAGGGVAPLLMLQPNTKGSNIVSNNRIAMILFVFFAI